MCVFGLLTLNLIVADI